jgi:tetratricopeptide (TPR) repeat protein
MKRVALVCAIVTVATFALAQGGYRNQSQNPPAKPPSGQAGAGANQQSGQPGAAPGAAQQGGAGQAVPAVPEGKRPPQAKTQPEFDAFKTASAGCEPTEGEKLQMQKDPASAPKILNDVADRCAKGAEEFAAKFADSELRLLLYKTTMRAYQNANNADKMLDMARKCLALDPNDPEALVGVAEVLTERTRDTDLDKDQRLDEATKAAQKALQTVDTNVALPAGTPQDKVDQYKGLLRSTAYSVLGALDFNKNNFAGAEANFRKSIDAFPQQPDPITVLRLSLALDRQNKYPEALTFANKAVGMTQEGSNAGSLARRERDRLVQLTGGTPAPAPAGSPAGSAGGTGTAPPPSTPPKQ